MRKRKSQNLKVKTKIKNSKFYVLVCGFAFCVFSFALIGFAQDNDIEFTLDLEANTIPLPKIFKPNIDLSGRGFHRDQSWPQGLAAQEALDIWKRDIGFNGIYRLQYNLWEMNELAKNKEAQEEFTNNYESIIKSISDAGGVVILDIFGTPAGLGKVLDKKSPPWDLKAFKQLIKGYIKNLSCDKRYNVWYEVWSAPDSEDFFLGRQQEYLNLYRSVAEAINELEEETKIHIPLGGPSTSWWFNNLDSNTIVTPEKSLIYGLIKFCSRYRLPLDFISWHGYSTDPRVEKEFTTYNKTVVALIRDWLSYFDFDRNTPLIVDEWNYDSGANVVPQRQAASNVSASYALSRIKNMYESGLDYQLYFCLEDFQNNKEGVVRNVGLFWFDPESSKYKGGPKSTYAVFRTLANLGKDMFSVSTKTSDEFVGVVATKSQGTITLLIYNYIDPDIATNYLSRNIASLNKAEKKALLGLIKANKLDKILLHELDIASLRISNKAKSLLKKALELNDKAAQSRNFARNFKLSIKNIKDNYLYQRYVIDLSCGLNCEFAPKEEKEISANAPYEEILSLSPYSVSIINLKKQKPKEPEAIAVSAKPEENMQTQPAPASGAAPQTNAASVTGPEAQKPQAASQ